MVKKYILPVIVLSQFCCTSLWFAGNGIMNDLVQAFGLNAGALGHLTSAVQLGFITGTLCFAILTVVDRFSPSKVFFSCAAAGALFNLGLLWPENSFWSILWFRFFTGFFLAGIYPVGMKIAADYFSKGLGKSLGFLVGALVLGTASPHLFKNMTQNISWNAVIIIISLIAIFGGLLLMLLVPDGPYRKAGQKLNLFAFLEVFRDQQFRASAFGYFGHMWELYAFWTFVPVMLKSYKHIQPGSAFETSLWSFLIIGIGGLSCVMGGLLSQSFGTRRTASTALLLSGLCCLLSPLVFQTNSSILFLGFLLFWGMVVIADSPLFSTMVANNAPPEIKGTALTTVNCIGFAITIISIQLINWLQTWTDSLAIYMILALGPVFGLVALRINNTAMTTGT